MSVLARSFWPRTVVALGLALFVLAARAAPPPRPSPTAEAEVRAALAALAHAFTTNDAERVVVLASRDMHLTHPTRGEVTYEMYAGGFREALGQPPRRDGSSSSPTWTGFT